MLKFSAILIYDCNNWPHSSHELQISETPQSKTLKEKVLVFIVIYWDFEEIPNQIWRRRRRLNIKR